MEDSGEPVQVLFVDEDGSYHLDEEALQRVVAHEAARRLPVCVVSVAGATRGGKSFLLDMFLRYLHATEENRRSGEWIGADDEPLTGFSWASGWEPNTTGILLWSKPIIVTQEVNGVNRRLAVVLMDTQGTFDSNTTIRASNTIFAMSTLMCSIQIYNLLQMINEDHLRHLQLFMEYGMMARAEDDAEVFQSLIFRIRDWEWPTRLPYGADGGERYLQEVYRVSALLREQIRPCFQSVSCVLTPYPGRVVTEENFNGLRNVEPEFKNSLLEIVPLILDPMRLAPKIINGHEVKIEDLPIHFRNYIEVFNSDDLPPSASIFEAMSASSLETALGEARATYCEHMVRGGGGARSVARGAVPRLHAAALRAARAAYAARRKLAQPAVAAARLQTLIQELDALLHNYLTINSDKIAVSITNSKAAYREHMNEGTQLCLLPVELEELHAAALNVALAVFDGSRATTPGDDADEVDGDRNILRQEVEIALSLYREGNRSRIERVCVEAREAYVARMLAVTRAARCLHPQGLVLTHQEAKEHALELFQRAWRENSAMNEHRDTLYQHMEASYAQYQSVNETNNNQALEEALRQYDNAMHGVCGSGKLCLHPLDLESEHEVSRTAASDYFLGQRSDHCRSLPLESFTRKLNNDIQRRYSNLKERNEELNEKAVAKALKHYNEKLRPGRDNFFPLFRGRDWGMLFRHDSSKASALEFFDCLRREGPHHDSDIYLEKLEKEIQESWNWAKKCDGRNMS